MNHLQRAAAKIINNFSCRPARATLFMVILFIACKPNMARSEKVSVNVSNNIGCTGSLTVASETGATPVNISPSSQFTINVTSLSRIVSMSILWKGISNSLCQAYCKLFVNGVKHTNGWMYIANYTENSPQYAFMNLQGSRTGVQELHCVKSSNIPVKFGQYPLP